MPVIAPGMATEAKHTGSQAGHEKALRGLTACAAGADVLSGGVGMLDSVNTFYLPQIVIDNEIAGMIRRLLADVEISHDAIFGDMVERVGIGGHFLAGEETRRRIRADEHFTPAISTRLVRRLEGGGSRRGGERARARGCYARRASGLAAGARRPAVVRLAEVCDVGRS